tara:strand:+ start:695 stop:1369 length:675 start_codon:yes stop_codon:yes gene_type:complete
MLQTNNTLIYVSWIDDKIHKDTCMYPLDDNIEYITNIFSEGLLKINFKKEYTEKNRENNYNSDFEKHIGIWFKKSVIIKNTKIKIENKNLKTCVIQISDYFENLLKHYIDNKREKFNYSKIKNIRKKLMSDKEKQLTYYTGLTRYEYNLIQIYTLNQLKEMSFQNHITKNIIREEIKENMSSLRTWAQAISYSKKWSLNTMKICIRKKNIILCDDIIFSINKFL